MIFEVALIEALNTAGLKIRRYSGRGMYGKECVAVSDDRRLQEILADLVEAYGDNLECAEAIRAARTDNMGLGIVVYWPHVAWPDDLEEDKDDE